MWYSLVLYFCRIALRCFGMLLTPACIRKTVSGPYPKKTACLRTCNTTQPSRVVSICSSERSPGMSNTKYFKNQHRISAFQPPQTHLQLPNFFTSPGSTSLSFTSLALSAQPLMQSSRKGSTNWSGAMPVVCLATWSRERWFHGNSAVMEIWN